MGGIALPALLGPGEDAVADAERAAPAALDHAQPRRRAVGVPLLRHGEDVAAVVGLDDPQHGDLRHAARLVEGAAGRAVDQPLVGHVLEQRLERILSWPDRPNARAISRLPAGWSDVAMKSRICLRLGSPVGRHGS